MKKKIFKGKLFFLSGLALAGLIVGSCGGGGGGTSSGSGNVSLYVTDAPIDDYRQVETTVNKIQLIHTGRGNSCDLLTTPTTFDITDLAGVMQLLNNASCPAENYNRVRIEFDKSVVLTNTDNITNTCSFTKYKDDDKFKVTPNQLQCDPNSNTCFIEINGAVNVLVKQNNNLTLDFNLKDFDVDNFGSQNCAVTMKVSPLHAAEIEDRKEKEHAREAITGAIFGLNTSLNTFTLRKGNHTFNVDYSIATGRINGKQVVPPVTTPGSGVPTLTVNTGTRAISGTVAFSNLTSNATEAHVHQGTVGTNGSKIDTISLTGGAGTKSGVFTIHTSILTLDQFDALKKERLYFNIHSESHPDGEIRAQIIYPSQTRIDELLQFALKNDLKVKVFCANSISDTNSCSATSLFLKLEGKVSNLIETDHTFTLIFKGNQTITVDYTQAYDNNGIEGVIAENKKVEIKLFNIDDKGSFMALQVKREHADGDEDEHECKHEHESED